MCKWSIVGHMARSKTAYIITLLLFSEIRGVLHWQGRLWKLVTMVINNINQTESGSQDINEWNRKISEVRNLQLAVVSD
jgi:HKD family nuclease